MKKERYATLAENGKLHDEVDLVQHGVYNRKKEYDGKVKQLDEKRKDNLARIRKNDWSKMRNSRKNLAAPGG